MMLIVAPLLSGWSPQLDSRSVVSRRAAVGFGAALVAPLPAVAKSKEAAKKEALQKATQKEARQAMKEYKFAPRPELEYVEGKGYIYKEGTVKAGSQGELASCAQDRAFEHVARRRRLTHALASHPDFNDKGATLQAQYQADRAKATGASSAKAKEIAEAKERAIREKNAAAKKRAISDDEAKIRAYAEKNKDLRDEYGRKVF